SPPLAKSIGCAAHGSSSEDDDRRVSAARVAQIPLHPAVRVIYDADGRSPKSPGVKSREGPMRGRTVLCGALTAMAAGGIVVPAAPLRPAASAPVAPAASPILHAEAL